MSAGPERLIFMANQIASFFDSQPGSGQAAAVADHIRAYWVPQMRRTIVEHLHDHAGEGLSPLAIAGVKLLEKPVVDTQVILAEAGRPSAKAPGDDAG